ncbi:MAG: glycosyltransferase [Bacteroidales bacterium]|jgi:glycosyltransferase involved in cell wall biosynthesis|nr:glycosyltransferase [Bacteroidales bacterium]
MILSIITVSRYYDEELFKTIKSVDNNFSSFIAKYEVDHIIVCSEKAEYANNDNRKYIYTPPKGIYNAMNIGLHCAIGEWVWFLNAGDECMEGIGAKLLQIMKLCNHNEIIIKAGVESIRKNNIKIMFGKIVSPHQGTFYRKKELKNIRGYREDYKIISDWIVFESFLSRKAKMLQTDLIVARFYENGISSTKEGKWLICKESFKCAMEHPTRIFRWYRHFKSIYNYIKNQK